MTVTELRVVLEHLPADLDVHVSSTSGQHLQQIMRMPRRQRAHMHPWVDLHGDHVLEPSVWLRGGGAWFKPAPAFELRGSFLRRSELDRRLDELDGVPAGLAESVA